MSPSDFTVEFYRKCLSQAKWDSDDERDTESIALLVKVANERRGDFLEEYAGAYFKHHTNFPVADKTATENPKQKTNTKTNTSMNTLLHEIYEILIKPLVEAIDRNTASKPTAAITTVSENPPTESEDKPAEPVKKRKSKAEAAPAPEPTPEPEPTPVEEPYMSGEELAELMKPLKDTKYTKILFDFRNDTLGFTMMTRQMTDPDMLRKMEAKIRECLAAHEADQNANV